MAEKFSELRGKTSPERRTRARARAQAMLAETPLHELRQARRLSQETLAETLHIGQASVSKMERRADMYVSTLRGIIRALDVPREERNRRPAPAGSSTTITSIRRRSAQPAGSSRNSPTRPGRASRTRPRGSGPGAA